MVWGIFFWGGGSIEDMVFGSTNCIFEYSNLVHIMWVLIDKYVGVLSEELILYLIYMSSILCGLINTYDFLVA